jgi:hypothetical protein
MDGHEVRDGHTDEECVCEGRGQLGDGGVKVADIKIYDNTSKQGHWKGSTKLKVILICFAYLPNLLGRDRFSLYPNRFQIYYYYSELSTITIRLKICPCVLLHFLISFLTNISQNVLSCNTFF